MTATAPLLRVYFAVVGLFAIWVGIWGYFFPGFVDQALPWMVPPLHARFIGSMYLSGAVLMFGALLSKSQAPWRIALLMATVWTGMLGLVSFLHLDQFDFARSPVWFWFFAYVAFPISGALLAWRLPPADEASGALPPGFVRPLATIQALVCVLLAAVLFFAPELMTTIWPWKITPLLAQIYAGPFLSYGIGSALVARSNSADAIRLPLISMAAFAVLVLAASLLHWGLFEPVGGAAVAWFGGLAISGLFLLYAMAHVWRRPAR